MHSVSNRQSGIRPVILLVLPSASVGGAERSLLALAENLQDVADARACLIRVRGGLLREFGSSTRTHGLWGRGLWPFRLLWLSWFERPTAIMSSALDVNLMVLAIKPLLPQRTRIVVREPIAPRRALDGRLRRALLSLYFRLCRRADAVIALTEELRDQIAKDTGLPVGRIRVIRNAVAPSRVQPPVSRLRRRSESWPQFVAVGRLAPQKGFDRLIRAFSVYVRGGGAGHLTIAGEGPEGRALSAMVADLGVERRVSLPGHVEDIPSFLDSADLFVLSSRYEGLSNAMIEALVAGVPVLALSGETGAEAFIREGVNGFLSRADTAPELAEDLRRAVERLSSIDRSVVQSDALETFSWQRHLGLYAGVLLGVEQTAR